MYIKKKLFHIGRYVLHFSFDSEMWWETLSDEINIHIKSKNIVKEDDNYKFLNINKCN